MNTQAILNRPWSTQGTGLDSLTGQGSIHMVDLYLSTQVVVSIVVTPTRRLWSRVSYNEGVNREDKSQSGESGDQDCRNPT